MEQQFNQPKPVTENIASTNIKPKAPVGVKIVAWLMLLGGIGSLFVVLPLLIINLASGIIQLFIAVGLIATSFGLHGMRKWALYVYTVIIVLALGSTIYSFFTSAAKEMTDFAVVGIEILVLIYLWSISKRFV